MNKIKNLVNVLAVAFGVSFLDGVFGWNLAGGFYTLVGLVEMIAIVWLLFLVNKNHEKNND